MENSSFTDSQVLHSSSLHSPSSEPPDIRNWFSSYVYESPELDSNDNFGDSISREREFEVEEDEQTAGEERFGEFRDVTKIDEEEAAENLKCTSLEDHRESQPLGMNQDSWCSQSLLSEPPDVGNWFSSYVYESPALNPSQEFGSCESEKTGLGHETEETLESVRRTKNGGEGIHLNPFVKCNGNSRSNRQDNQPLKEDLFSESTSEQDPKEKNVETNEINPIKEVPISNDDNKFDLILESSESEVQTQLNGSSAGNDLPSVFTNKQSIREPIVLSNNKENKGKRVSDDGFITASKRKFSGATCKKSVLRQENYNVKEIGSAFGCLSRKPLSDKTNVEHSDIVEIIGKWSCPQKRKPNLGPPLKQLRLERWVHRK